MAKKKNTKADKKKGGKKGGGGGGGKATGGKISHIAPKKKKKKTGAPTEPPPVPRLKVLYNERVRAALKEKFGFKGDLATPRITKVVASMGIGDAGENPKKFEQLLSNLETMTGQRPQVTRARISVANFNLREGVVVGCRSTLRRARMWEFLDRILTVVVPRLRDFRGMKTTSFDGRGNYAFGLPDQLVFPEINADRVDFFNGVNIVVCTTAQNDEHALELLRLMGFPFADLLVEVIGKKEAEL